MAMTVAEARAEIKGLYSKADLIEKKYPEGEITNGEDLNEVKRLLTEIDTLEAKLSGLEDAEQRKNRILAGMDRFTKPAPGAQHPNPVVQEILEGKRIDPGTQFVT